MRQNLKRYKEVKLNRVFHRQNFHNLKLKRSNFCEKARTLCTLIGWIQKTYRLSRLISKFGREVGAWCTYEFKGVTLTPTPLFPAFSLDSFPLFCLSVLHFPKSKNFTFLRTYKYLLRLTFRFDKIQIKFRLFHEYLWESDFFYIRK